MGLLFDSGFRSFSVFLFSLLSGLGRFFLLAAKVGKPRRLFDSKLLEESKMEGRGRSLLGVLMRRNERGSSDGGNEEEGNNTAEGHHGNVEYRYGAGSENAQAVNNRKIPNPSARLRLPRVSRIRIFFRSNFKGV